MIRRLFWMALGAVLGVSGYRKAAMMARAMSPAHARARAAGRLARGTRATAAFARDVREGMAIYRLAEVRRAPTLERPALERPTAERPTAERHRAVGRHSRTQDWVYAKAPAARDCPDEVKDGR